MSAEARTVACRVCGKHLKARTGPMPGTYVGKHQRPEGGPCSGVNHNDHLPPGATRPPARCGAPVLEGPHVLARMCREPAGENGRCPAHPARPWYAEDDDAEDQADVEAEAVAGPGHVVIIGCSGDKADAAAPARDLYRGDLFAKSVRWAEARGLPWLVLSALHGLVAPDDVLEPYDTTLRTRSDRDALVPGVAAQLAALGLERVTVLAGGNYLDVVTRAAPAGLEVATPLQDLPRRGIGWYRQWLAQAS